MSDVMQDHFMITSWARDAVIAGSLEELRGPLTALAANRYDDIPTGGWVASIAQLQAAARLTSNAATLDVAAMGVATMARVCGECHVKNHGGPALPSPPDPVAKAAADTVGDRMGRHMWAAELLWQELTGPSDVSWKAGAKRLVAAPAELDDELPESFNRELREVQALGQSAREAATLVERADVYGLLIATCTDCHSSWIEDHGL